MHSNPSNRNQALYFEPVYKGLPVFQNKGPLVLEYLESLHRVTCQALAAHKRILAIRLDLHFPLWMEASDNAIGNQVISRFIESLKAKVRYDRVCAKKINRYAHDTELRYVWARETGIEGRVHYHVAILVSREAYFTLGHFESGELNMASRCREAWASALGLPLDQAQGLVHFPENPTYRFERDTPEEKAAFFYRASYLCKASTKQFGDGNHGFGASRF